MTISGSHAPRFPPTNTKNAAAGFWLLLYAFFTAAGITVTEVMGDNGSCYHSRDFATALDPITHRFTRP